LNSRNEPFESTRVIKLFPTFFVTTRRHVRDHFYFPHTYVVWNVWKVLVSLINYKKMVLDHFTEKPFHRKFLIERPFDRNTIWPNTVWSNAIRPKVHLTESLFDRRTFDRKFILPKKVIWPKTKFIKMSFDRNNLKNGHLTANLTWKNSQMTVMT
jgi:hypothetical protein